MSNVNYEYLAAYCLGLPDAGRLRILDYGCGNGALVKRMREAGLDAHGAEVFYEGAAFSLKEDPLFGEGIFRAIAEEGDLPYPEGHFDVIVANQVFEHVRDLDAAARRLHRVLAAGGRMLLHFPSREVLWEGHIGLPLVHWMKPGSRGRRAWALGLRRMGLGYHKGKRTSEEWVDAQLEWIDRYCFYRPYREIRRVLDPLFEVRHAEWGYIRFRAERTRGMRGAVLRTALGVAGTKGMQEGLFRRLAFMALELRKK